MPAKKKHETEEHRAMREQKREQLILRKEYKKRCIREANNLMRFHTKHEQKEIDDELYMLKSKITKIETHLNETEKSLRSITSGMETYLTETGETKLNTTIIADNISKIKSLIRDFQSQSAPRIDTAMEIFNRISHVRQKIAKNSTAFYSEILHQEDWNKYKDLHKIKNDISAGDAKKYKEAMNHFKNVNLYIFDNLRHMYNDSPNTKKEVKTVKEIYNDLEIERADRMKKKMDRNRDRQEKRRDKDEEYHDETFLPNREKKAAINARKQERKNKKESIQFGQDGQESQLSTSELLKQMKSMQLSM
jgi:hypothetical protein